MEPSEVITVAVDLTGLDENASVSSVVVSEQSVVSTAVLTGPKGDSGLGVPLGGTTNQALTKIDGVDYNAHWATIDKTFVGLGNVDDTSDLGKPISVATQAALDAKQPVGSYVVNRDTDITYTVGSGGDYATISSAIAALSMLRPKYKNNGFTATVSLLTGFTMAEQVIVRNNDLSWITITSVDSTVPVDPSAITTILQPIGAAYNDDIYPIFGADNGVLPIIGARFAYPDNGDGYADPLTVKDGVGVIDHSHVTFLPGAGVNRARSGLKVLYNSSSDCYMPGLTQGGAGTGAGTVTGVEFTYATRLAIHVGYGSKANMARSLLHHSKGSYGAYVIWGSHVDLYQSQIYDTTNGYAITCRDGSFANMRETSVARSKRGYHALHNARINARNHANIWSTDSATNCTEYGILCSYNSHIDASEVDVSGSGTGCNASGSSSVNFDIGFANNCTVRGISAVGCSFINAEGTVANTLTTGDNASATVRGIGFYAQNGSTINARDSSATRCVVGYQALDDSDINGNNAIADNSTTGFLSQALSRVNVDSSSATRCVDAYKAIEKSDIQARNSNADGATHYAFWSERLSLINARGSSAQSLSSPTATPAVAFYAFEQGYINAQSTNVNGATIGYYVDRDGDINAGGSSGTATTKSNVPINYRSGKGYIADAAASNFGLTFDETTARGTFTNGASGISKSDVGLANVDNTSDANKPVSTAQAAALALKQDKTAGWTVVTSGVQVSHTGDTVEFTLATINVPANALGPNGMIRLTVNFSCTNNANTKTVRARYDGASGTQFLNSPLISQARLHTPVFIYNHGATNSQIGGANAGNQSGYGQSTSNQVTASVDTTAATTLVVTGQLANAADTVTLESYSLEYHYQA